MVRHETFRRVPKIHESRGSSDVCPARRNKKAGSRIQEAVRRESEQTRTKKEKAEAGQTAFRFRPRAERYRLTGSFRFFVLLRGKLCIRETLADDLRAQKAEAVAIVHGIALRCPIVEPETLLIQIPEHVEGFNAHIRSLESALQQTPEIFQTVCVNLPVYVTFRMIHDLMNVLLIQSPIRVAIIGRQVRAKLNIVLHHSVKGAFVTIWNYLRSHFASATLKESSNDGFIGHALSKSRCACSCFLVLVHESRLAADESFVNFNMAAASAKLATFVALHSKTDSVKHEPCCLLRDTQGAVNFPRRNAILAIGDHPHHGQPLIQSKRRVLKDTSGLDAELRFGMASLALPETAGRNERYILAATSRTDHAIRPAAKRKVVNAVIGVSEVLNRVCECLGFHASNHARKGLMSQVYFYPSHPRLA